MKKDVWVSITGVHTPVMETRKGRAGLGEGKEESEAKADEGADYPVGTLHKGVYYYREGRHVIFFEESGDGSTEMTRTRIRLTDYAGNNFLEVIKKGAISAHMTFEEGKTGKCSYKTGYGQLNLGTRTRRMKARKTPDRIDIMAEYSLEMKDDSISDCTLMITIQPR